MSISEVGLVDSLAFLVGVLFEFPSGVISDRIGRKKTLILSQVVQFFGSFMILISDSKFEIAFGFIIFQLGTALYSGTIESFGYESANSENFDYDKVLTTSSFLSNFGYLFSVLVGGYLYSQNINYPNFLTGLNYLIGLLFSFLIIDKAFNENHELSGSNKIDLKKFDLTLILKIILIFSICFSFDYGFLKLKILESFSNTSNNYFYIFISTILSLVLSKILIEKVKDYNKYIQLNYILLVALLILSYFYTQSLILLFFILSFLAINIYQVSLKYLNERLHDSERASYISIFNLFYKIPYVFMALILGYSLETQRITNILFYLGIFLIIGYILIKKIPRIRYNRG